MFREIQVCVRVCIYIYIEREMHIYTHIYPNYETYVYAHRLQNGRRRRGGCRLVAAEDNVAPRKGCGGEGGSLLERLAPGLWQARGVKPTFTDGSYTKGTRAHTHRELIREWL